MKRIENGQKISPSAIYVCPGDLATDPSMKILFLCLQQRGFFHIKMNLTMNAFFSLWFPYNFRQIGIPYQGDSTGKRTKQRHIHLTE